MSRRSEAAHAAEPFDGFYGRFGRADCRGYRDRKLLLNFLPPHHDARADRPDPCMDAAVAVDIDTHVLDNASAPYVDRRLIGGSAALLTGGLLACLAGAAVGAVAVVRACRRYVADLDEPPRATVRRRWEQLRSASTAGVGAWQDYDQQGRPDRVR